MNTDLIFVYGLLKSTQDNKASSLIRSKCEFVAEGWFPGSLFNVGTYPGAVYREGSSSKVYGELHRILTDKKELLDFLDRFEGVGPEFEEPNEYKKEIIPVHTGVDILHARCYLYNWNSDGLKVIESGRYGNT